MKIIKYIPKILLLLVFMLSLNSVADANSITKVVKNRTASGPGLSIHATSPLKFVEKIVNAQSMLEVTFPGSHLTKTAKIPAPFGSFKEIKMSNTASGAKMTIHFVPGAIHRLNKNKKGNELVVAAIVPFDYSKKWSGGPVLENVEMTAGEDQVDLIFTGQHMDTKHEISLINNNKTLVIDFYGAQNNLTTPNFNFNPSVMKDFSVRAHQGAIKVIANLKKPLIGGYHIETNTNSVLNVRLKFKGTPVEKSDLVSVDFKEIDIRAALQKMADMKNINLVMGSDIKGTITIRLKNVSWKKALETILESNNLGMIVNDNIYRIADVNVINKTIKNKQDSRLNREAAAELITKKITLGYASVEDVKATLIEAKSSGKSSTSTGEQSLKLLSPRGQILLDSRTNTLIITDTADRVDEISDLVKIIDKPTQQVLIEAHIIEATEDFSKDMGVRWGGNSTGSVGSGLSNTFYGAASPNATLGAMGNAVDLGASVGAGFGGAIGYTLTKLAGGLNLNLELSAAEQNGDVKVVSSPHIFTNNLKEAWIEQDKQIPFQTTTFNGGATTVSTTMVSAKLSLKVTPQITPDSKIILTLEVNKDTPINSVIAGGAPTIDKKQLSTNLVVKNGETVVLGGIYTNTTSNTTTGVPGLQDAPLVGNLFKRKQKSSTRNELMIFITPTVVTDQVKKK